jgi:hypothetical protein
MKEPQDFKSGATQEEEVQPKIPHDHRGGGHEEKDPEEILKQEKVEAILTPKENISKIQHLEVEP